MKQKRLVHTERIPVRWGDMDAMGHVNNTVYFRYMEQARIGWFGALVPQAEAWNGCFIVIANASCNFKRPINYPGTVAVRVFIDPPGGSSVETFYELTVQEDLYADGTARLVFVDTQRQKPVRIPAKIREAMQ
jgi:acyl-CoA thioester hydrolase